MTEDHPHAQCAEDADGLMREGDHLFHTGCFADAADVYATVAGLGETPTGELCAKLARCLAEAGRPREACVWALQVADSVAGFAAWTAAAKVLDRCGETALPYVRRRLRTGIVGTWTTSAFVPLFKLAATRAGIAAEIYEAPFNQYFNETLDPASPLFATRPEALILCPDFHATGLPSFADDAAAAVEEGTEQWTAVWAAARAVAPLIIVQHNFAMPGADGFGHFGAGLEGSRRSVAAEVNRHLAIQAGREDVGIVDVDYLASRFGKDAWFDDRNWYLAKMAVSPAALPLLARHTAAVLAARLGLSRRCLVLDLDNTLWGGVVGDDGVDGLTLGDGPDGEAFVDFQRAIKELSASGIVLAVCSKNDPETARKPFLSHPEMVLKLEDMAAFAANWRPKSENIIEVARTLNLGLDAITFADDNPYERAEVRRALPEVDILPLPSEPTAYRRALEDYPFFERSSFTVEDRNRSRQYQARTEAAALRGSSGSLDDFQASLGMVATIGPLDDVNMPRIVQLINKTNQFNVTTRRRNRSGVAELVARPGVEHFWVRLRDRFADHGLIAVLIAVQDGGHLDIDTFLMSCRVMGRGVEAMVLDELVERARQRGCSEIRGLYIPTSRNAPVADLFPRLGFSEAGHLADGGTAWVLPVAGRNRSGSLIMIQPTDTDEQS